ncbi:hypothetical protein FOC84_10265 [Achromobacter pestifer]|uniref:Uncharacterized protein n=1 Tax=Achromobacter pestifer TaxID=1353889 RepID=A0A7D4E0N2_9BURK|nr:hypothetical protein [Achromobacter pestifer]QKH35310.1 hypothetical protein FOC84_10265 [Achromobacter pestifer]
MNDSHDPARRSLLAGSAVLATGAFAIRAEATGQSNAQSKRSTTMTRNTFTTNWRYRHVCH